jgi:uncharacterized repeat protein (TIGR03803 family)
VALPVAHAQIFSTLHDFRFNDGSQPHAGLVLVGDALYGTTFNGVNNNNGGALFRINTDGTGFTNLHSFVTSESPNSDGQNPVGALTFFSNKLYGTAGGGGLSPSTGIVFAVGTNGSEYTILHEFGGADGDEPNGGLVPVGSVLYGTTLYGGTQNRGSVFSVSADGLVFASLHSFTNLDGQYPLGSLVLSDGGLYGTTSSGGSSGAGTLFKINPDGSAFTNLHVFSGVDGGHPRATLIASGGTLYGTTVDGGDNGTGTVFKLNTDGSGFSTFHSFAATDQQTNSGGANPMAPLILAGDTLYGTAELGGTAAQGTVFALKTDGTYFATVFNFSNSQGVQPQAGLVLSGNTLYGTAYAGGAGYYGPLNNYRGSGTLFALSLGPIPIQIRSSAEGLILAWGNPAFLLQSGPSVVGPYANISDASSPYLIPVVGSGKFFRLKSN